jgi:hypothetical protein
MRRIIIAGGTGFFGNAAAELLERDGRAPIRASRRSGELPLDVEDAVSIRSALKAGDIVIDAVGPFQGRSTTLVEGAIDVGFDLLDISDSTGFCESVADYRQDIDRAGITVLTACSSISSMSAAWIRYSGLPDPIRLTAYLAPATKYAAVPGTSESLLHSIGQPIRSLRNGVVGEEIGWKDRRDFHCPIGWIRGRQFESADGFTLREHWPGLEEANFYVDGNVPGLNAAMDAICRLPVLLPLVKRTFRWGLPFARTLGSAEGCLGFEIEDRSGVIVRYALVGRNRGYFTPVVPPVIVAGQIADGTYPHSGWVGPEDHIDHESMMDWLARVDVEVWRCAPVTSCE